MSSQKRLCSKHRRELRQDKLCLASLLCIIGCKYPAFGVSLNSWALFPTMCLDPGLRAGLLIPIFPQHRTEITAPGSSGLTAGRRTVCLGQPLTGLPTSPETSEGLRGGNRDKVKSRYGPLSTKPPAVGSEPRELQGKLKNTESPPPHVNSSALPGNPQHKPSLAPAHQAATLPSASPSCPAAAAPGGREGCKWAAQEKSQSNSHGLCI